MSNVGDEVAQKDISDAEAISRREIREPRRRNSPSDPSSREDHVPSQQGTQVSGRGVQERGRVERHEAQGRKEPEDGSKIPVLSCDYCLLGARNRINEAEVEQRGDSPVLAMHDGVTKSIFAHLIPAKGLDFPSCDRVVKMITEDFGQFGIPQSGASVRQRALHSCTAQGGEVGLDLHPLKVARNPTVLQKVQ